MGIFWGYIGREVHVPRGGLDFPKILIKLQVGLPFILCGRDGGFGGTCLFFFEVSLKISGAVLVTCFNLRYLFRSGPL